ncbi:MAG: FprA family A-type flavoprotein [Clostridiales bacterium]|nr:FprA family A-type flavoprotein [Clostridiales bacterium]
MHNITESIKYIGVSDKELKIFENQYPLKNGMAYNSYFIDDEKLAVFDTVDAAKTDEWLENLESALAGRQPDYLIISHLEPDHSANVSLLVQKFPEITLVASAKAFAMLGQFFDIPAGVKKLAVKEGDTLCLGKHTLSFIMAPMIHWPEVIMTYEQSERVLFSADAFGKFGAFDCDEDWACEARRYYFNIVGKYGQPVQTLLKKVLALDVRVICALHGPVLSENLEYYINLYNTWSSYSVESEGVFIAYASIYGNTEKAVFKLKEILEKKGCPRVAISNLAKDDIAEAVADAFRYGKEVFMAASYDGGVFPPMEAFLCHLKSKAFQNRRVALVENGSWGPTAARAMKALIEPMKNITLCDKSVTIKTTLSKANETQLEELADEILA